MGDYATTIQIESLLDTGRRATGSQARPDIAMLRGIRFLATSGPGKGDMLNESFIKQLTGEDRIIARQLHKDFFEFRPVAKLTMQGNFRPKISGTDEGIWGRVILVPWNIFIPQEERDRDLPRKLEAEASGILNRMLDGLRDWMDNGLTVPAGVREATTEYRSDSDPLSRFLAACTRHELGSRVKASDIYAVFVAWARANGENVWSAKGFGGAMRDAGTPNIKSNTSIYVDGRLRCLRLTSTRTARMMPSREKEILMIADAPMLPANPSSSQQKFSPYQTVWEDGDDWEDS